MAVSNSIDRFNGVLASKAIKVRCVVGAILDVPLLEGSQVIEGILVATGDRVLLTAQTNPVLNGIYDVLANEWERAPDWDGSRDVELGSTVWAGSQTGDDILYQVTAPAGNILPGSTAVTITILLDPNSVGGIPGTTVDSTVRYDGADYVENLNLLVEADGRVTHPNAMPTRWLNLAAAPVEMLDFQEQSLAVSGVGSVVANFEGTNGDRVYTGEDGRVWTFAGQDALNEIDTTEAAFGVSSYNVGEDTTSHTNDRVYTDIDSEYLADFVCGTRNWYFRFWVFITNSLTGGNDFGCIGQLTGNNRDIRWQSNNNVFSLAYNDTGGGGENTFPTFGASPVDSAWHEVVFERFGNGIYCYLDGVQNGSTYDCTGEDIGGGMTQGTAVMMIGCSVSAGLFNGTPKPDTYIDSFDCKIGTSLYGGVAPGSPSGQAPVADAETMVVGDPGYRTRIDGNALNIAGAYDLPLVDGSGGQALVTDGEGRVTFGAASPVGSTLGSTLVYDGAVYAEELNVSYLENQDLTGSGVFGNELTITDTVRDFVGITFQTVTTNAHVFYGETLDTLFLNSQNIELGANETRVPGTIRFGAVGDGLSIETVAGGMELETAFGSNRDLDILADNGTQDMHFVFGTGIKITGKASAHANTTGSGQIWVDSGDELLKYTTESGVEYDLTALGGSPFATPLQILGNINTATPPTTEAVTSALQFMDLAGDDLLGDLRFIGSNTMTLRNYMHGGQIRIEGESAAGTNRSLLIFRPDSTTTLNAVSNLVLTCGNNDDAVFCTANAQVALYHNDILAMATRTQALGGLGAYNAYSGGGSLYRVMTDVDFSYSDLRQEFSTNTTTSDPGNRAIKTNNASIVAATELYINDLDTHSDDNQWFMRALAEGDTFVMFQENDKDAVHVLEVTGPPVDNTGWWTIPINRIAGQSSNYVSGVVRLTASFGLAAAGGGGGTTLAALTDTDVAGVADHDMMFFDTASGDWKDTGGLLQADVDGATIGMIINDVTSAKDGALLIQDGVSTLQGLSLATNSAGGFCSIQTPILGNTELWLVAENGGSAIVLKASSVNIAGATPSVDHVAFSDDDTDFNTVAASKVDWNISGFSGAMRITGMDLNLGDSDLMTFGTGDDVVLSYDGALNFEVNIPTEDSLVVSEAGTIKFSINHFSNRVDVHDGYELYVRSADDGDWIRLTHDGFDGHIHVGGATPGSIIMDEAVAFNSDVDTIAGNAATLTLELANAFEIDLDPATGNVTLTLSGTPPTGRHYICSVKVIQDSTDRTITWAGGSFLWAGGVAHVMATGNDAVSIFTFETWDAGTTWYASGADYS